MKTSSFKQMLVAYAKKFNVDPKTPVLVNWGESNLYHGIFQTDGDGEGKGIIYLICHQQPVYGGKHGGPVSFTYVPTWKKECALSETMTFEQLLSDSLSHCQEIKVLIATQNLPQNIPVDIDPWSCKLIDGSEKPTFILRCRVDDECKHRNQNRVFKEDDCVSEVSNVSFLQKEFEGSHHDCCDKCEEKAR